MAETVALIQAEATVPEALRALALRSLAVQMADRTRSTLVVTAITSRASGGVLSVVLHGGPGKTLHTVSCTVHTR